MSVITSSNRSRRQWREYIEPPENLDRLMREVPHVGTMDVIAAHAITPSGPSVFAHVIAVDECGAPILDPAAHELIACENQ